MEADTTIQHEVTVKFDLCTGEEDKLQGYLKMLKIGPQLLKFIPNDTAQDLRSWLEMYRFWNEGVNLCMNQIVATSLHAIDATSDRWHGRGALEQLDLVSTAAFREKGLREELSVSCTRQTG